MNTCHVVLKLPSSHEMERPGYPIGLTSVGSLSWVESSIQPSSRVQAGPPFVPAVASETLALATS